MFIKTKRKVTYNLNNNENNDIIMKITVKSKNLTF